MATSLVTALSLTLKYSFLTCDHEAPPQGQSRYATQQQSVYTDLEICHWIGLEQYSDMVSKSRGLLGKPRSRFRRIHCQTRSFSSKDEADTKDGDLDEDTTLY